MTPRSYSISCGGSVQASQNTHAVRRPKACVSKDELPLRRAWTAPTVGSTSSWSRRPANPTRPSTRRFRRSTTTSAYARRRDISTRTFLSSAQSWQPFGCRLQTDRFPASAVLLQLRREQRRELRERFLGLRLVVRSAVGHGPAVQRVFVHFAFVFAAPRSQRAVQFINGLLRHGVILHRVAEIKVRPVLGNARQRQVRAGRLVGVKSAAVK